MHCKQQQPCFAAFLECPVLTTFTCDLSYAQHRSFSNLQLSRETCVSRRRLRAKRELCVWCRNDFRFVGLRHVNPASI